MVCHHLKEIDMYNPFRESFLRLNFPLTYSYNTRWYDPFFSFLYDHFNRAFWWVKHRTTNKYHVLKLFDEPGWREIDQMVEAALINLANLYLEQELGRSDELFDEVYGEPISHRGYRLHSTRDKERIDLVLSINETYKAYQEAEYYSDEHQRLYGELTNLLMQFVKERSSFWT